MSVWTQTQVNGALADSLVNAFGTAFAANTSLSPDSRLCLTLHYSSVSAHQVRLFLATAAGVTNDQIVMIYDSATAGATQFITDFSVRVPIISGTLLPMALRITKDNVNASLRYTFDPSIGPC